MIRVADTVLTPAIELRMKKLTQADWSKFGERVQLILSDADRVVHLFENQFEPEQFTAVLEIRDRVHSILALYRLIPDVTGVRTGTLSMTL